MQNRRKCIYLLIYYGPITFLSKKKKDFTQIQIERIIDLQTSKFIEKSGCLFRYGICEVMLQFYYKINPLESYLFHIKGKNY